MSASATIDGYVADTPYPSGLRNPCLPAWSDACLLLAGEAPPRAAPRAPFTLVDLGCGDGFGLAAMATAYPEGRFIGYDALPAHVEAGKARLKAWGLGNAELRLGRFGEFEPDVAADYVTAYGVLAWVSPMVQAALIETAARLLRPGGVFTVSYNALPGWLPRLPFQRLLYALSLNQPGDAVARFRAAHAAVKASGMIARPALEDIQSIIDVSQEGYLPHEFLNAHWQPLWADEVIRRIEASGLVFINEAHPVKLLPRFTLRERERTALAAIESRAAREIATDCLFDTRFRIDLYRKPPAAPLSSEALRERRLDGCWYATRSEAAADYHCDGPAGTLRFNNAAAHAILRHLEAGPASLRPLAGIGPANLLNTADALFAAGLISPAEPPAEAPAATWFNFAVLEAQWRGEALNAMAGRGGVVRLSEHGFRDLDAESRRRLGLDGLLPELVEA